MRFRFAEKAAVKPRFTLTTGDVRLDAEKRAFVRHGDVDTVVVRLRNAKTAVVKFRYADMAAVMLRNTRRQK